MKYVRKTSYDIKEDFLKNLLIDRGVIEKDRDFLNKFFYPTKANLIDYQLLSNISAAADMVEYHIKNGNKIYLIVDPDVDGYTSSSIFYNYLMKNYKPIYPNFLIDYHIPEGKEHGLQTLMKDLTEEKKYDLIVLPDAGSNDITEHKKLKEIGYDVCCLDHHIVSKKSDYAVIVNNQSSENYSNKDLSGVGVVYQFLRLLDKRNGWDNADDYLDLTALGVISDMMRMFTLENRYICDYGLSHIQNKFFAALVEKQSYSLGNGPLNQIGIAFYITPLINALIRMGNQTEKERLFQAFITPDLEVPSTKRGEKGKIETVCEQSVRNCINAKARQNREKDKIIELLDIQIMNNCLDENKILVLNADELDIPNTLTGLCAMGIAAKYKKPVLLGRTGPDGHFKGSIRGRDDSELKDFRKFLLNSNLMDFVEGHAQAAGFSLKNNNVDKIISYANKELRDINFNEGYYEVDFIAKGNCQYLSSLIEDLNDEKRFFGQGNPEPLIAVEDIILPPSGYTIIGKNNDTVKFEFNEITYIKFKAIDLIEELKKQKEKINLTIVGKGNINEWGGQRKPQILIDATEIKESSIYDF